MAIQTYPQTLVSGVVDGPTLTAAAAASFIPTPSRIILPNNYFYIGKTIHLTLTGRISCAVTTPGTARLDFRTGPSGTIVAFDTGPMNLNVNAKTNVPWWFELVLTCRSVGTGTGTTLMGVGKFTSEATIGSPIPTVGGVGALLSSAASVSGPPAVGTGFDSTAANAIDMFFTQTVATGSFTLHQYIVKEWN